MDTSNDIQVEVMVTHDLHNDYNINYVPPSGLTKIINWFRTVTFDLFGYN